MQIDLVDDVDALLGLGVPDFRLAVLPARVEAMLDELGASSERRDPPRLCAVPWVREQCDELASFGLPETIQHDDLHDGQVFVRDGRYLLLDWGDACVSHPFFTLAVTLDGVIAWGVDDVEGSEDTDAVPGRLSGAVAASARQADLVPPARSRDAWAGCVAPSTARGSQPPDEQDADRGCGCSSTAMRSMATNPATG